MKKRIISTVLLFLIFLTPITRVFASSVKLHYEGERAYWKKFYTRMVKDDEGKVAYCVQPNKQIPAHIRYNFGTRQMEKRMVNILKHGYPLNYSGLREKHPNKIHDRNYYISTWVALNIAMGNFYGETVESASNAGDDYIRDLLSLMDVEPENPKLKPVKRDIKTSKNDALGILETEPIEFVGQAGLEFNLHGFVGGVGGSVKIVDADTRVVLPYKITIGQKFRIVADLGYEGEIEVKPVGHDLKDFKKVLLEPVNVDYQDFAYPFTIGDPYDIMPFKVKFRGEKPEPKPNISGQITKKDVEDGYGVNGANFLIKNNGRFTKTPETTDDDGNIVPATYYEAGEYTINVTTSGDGSASYELPEYSGETSWSVRETKAPYGYYKSEDGEQTLGGNTFKNKRQKGKITITKVDNENSYINHNDKTKPQGDGQLDGAVFDIVADEDIILPNISNKVVHKKGDVVETLVIKNGRAESGLHELGTYKVVERQLPEGYWYQNYQKKFTPFITSISSLFILI